MGVHRGKEGVIKIGSNAVAEVRNWQTDENADTLETTSLSTSDDWKTNIASLKGFTGSLSGLWDETDTNGQGSLTNGASVTLNLYPEGDGSGATYFTGDAILTGISRTASFDGLVEFTANFLGDGALTETTVGA